MNKPIDTIATGAVYRSGTGVLTLEVQKEGHSTPEMLMHEIGYILSDHFGLMKIDITSILQTFEARRMLIDGFGDGLRGWVVISKNAYDHYIERHKAAVVDICRDRLKSKRLRRHSPCSYDERKRVNQRVNGRNSWHTAQKKMMASSNRVRWTSDGHQWVPASELYGDGNDA